MVRTKTDNPLSVSDRFRRVQNDLWEAAIELAKTTPGQIIPPRPQLVAKPKELKGYDGIPEFVAAAVRNVPRPRDPETEIADWRRRADDMAAKHIVVGERAYELSSEPMYKVIFNAPDRILFAYDAARVYSVVTRDFRQSELGGLDLFAFHFNVDQEEQALQLFEARKKPENIDANHGVHIERWLDDYQCVDNDAFEMDKMAKMVLNDVSWGITVRSRTRPMILDVGSTELINSVMHLKAMVDSRDPAQGVDDDLDVAMERVIEAAVGGAKTRPYLRPKVREMALYSIDRWRQRPIVMPSQSLTLSR
ncbi:hypothetical protein [Rhizobium sp. BK176]|uniref:hypothetical protein n=1 Tax=Rhizobium sp. BK176 TaxID=2587071 RepID=UPI0021691FAE|nr:hypothetical protein [Rhizobium sp. BK176]MCS4089247.1 hypothetical protein [Rhizobium sp. BK176]